MYQLFLDDKRDIEDVYPTHDERKRWQRFIIVRTVEDAIALIEEMEEFPSYVSFDNDLGTKLEGKDLAKWMVDMAVYGHYSFTERFDFRVHSANLPAGQYIQDLMDNYLAFGTKTCMHGVPLSENCHPCFIDLPSGFEPK